MTGPAGVRNDEAAGRYVLPLDDGSEAIAAYERRGDAVVFTHTAVPDDEQGRGIGSTLIRGALADVRSKELRVVPRCPFVAAYIDAHPEEADLLA